MSYPHPPPRPTGNSPEAIFMQRVWDVIWDPKTKIFVEAVGLKFDKTPKGYIPHIKPGKGGGKGSFLWQSPRECNPAVTVPKDTFVFISSDNPLVTTGIVDLVSGTLTKAQPGFWQAAQAVPAQVTISSVVKYNVPQYPYPGDTGYDAGPPVSGDLDDEDIYWIYWGALNC